MATPHVSEPSSFRTAGGYRDALSAYLKRSGKGVDVGTAQREFAADRLLARLEVVAPGMFLLQGHGGLRARGLGAHRPLKDLDLQALVDLSTADAFDLLKQIENVDLGDGLTFEVTALKTMKRAQKAAVAVKIGDYPIGRGAIGVDLAVGRDAPLLEPQRVGPMRSLPDIKAPGNGHLTLAVEEQLAKKIRAIVVPSGPSGCESPRAKDLVDALAITRSVEIDPSAFAMALEAEFVSWGHDMPKHFVPPSQDHTLSDTYRQQWDSGVRKMLKSSGMNTTVEAAYAELANFVDPVLGRDKLGVWEPVKAEWQPPVVSISQTTEVTMAAIRAAVPAVVAVAQQQATSPVSRPALGVAI